MKEQLICPQCEGGNIEDRGEKCGNDFSTGFLCRDCGNLFFAEDEREFLLKYGKE